MYKLMKALYGLKQAPRAWYSEIDSYFLKTGFERSKSEPTLYVKKQGTTEILIASLYVDDLVFTGNNERMIESFKRVMMKKYEMSDMVSCITSWVLRFVKIRMVFLFTKRSMPKILFEKFRMGDCKPVATPLIVNEKLKKEDGGKEVDVSVYRSLVGSLLYLTATRPDSMYETSMLSRFMHKPKQNHFGAAKRVLRYIKGTLGFGILYERNIAAKLLGFCDSDWGGCADDMKSTSGYAFSLGSGIFSWSSKKQQSV